MVEEYLGKGEKKNYAVFMDLGKARFDRETPWNLQQIYSV